MDINVRGVWYTTSAAVTAMRDGGRIILRLAGPAPIRQSAPMAIHQRALPGRKVDIC